jgi:trehalose 6-phosphate synthase/phosphatase
VNKLLLLKAQALLGCCCRSSGKDLTELHDYVLALVQNINSKYSQEGYQPVVWFERTVPLYEKIALYSIADVAVVTATRDGMNLVPYEYIVCRQGPPPKDDEVTSGRSC